MCLSVNLYPCALAGAVRFLGWFCPFVLPLWYPFFGYTHNNLTTNKLRGFKIVHYRLRTLVAHVITYVLSARPFVVLYPSSCPSHAPAWRLEILTPLVCYVVLCVPSWYVPRWSCKGVYSCPYRDCCFCNFLPLCPAFISCPFGVPTFTSELHLRHNAVTSWSLLKYGVTSNKKPLQRGHTIRIFSIVYIYFCGANLLHFTECLLNYFCEV